MHLNIDNWVMDIAKCQNPILVHLSTLNIPHTSLILQCKSIDSRLAYRDVFYKLMYTHTYYTTQRAAHYTCTMYYRHFSMVHRDINSEVDRSINGTTSWYDGLTIQCPIRHHHYKELVRIGHHKCGIHDLPRQSNEEVRWTNNID